MPALLITTGLIATAAVFVQAILSRQRINRLALERVDSLSESEGRRIAGAASSRSIFRRQRYLILIVGLSVAAIVYFAIGWAMVFAVALGVIVAILTRQAESLLIVRKTARIELQLADAIDLMIGALALAPA